MMAGGKDAPNTLIIKNSTVTATDTSNSSDAGTHMTLNMSDSVIIGGESLDRAMQITGYDTVKFNMNYLAPLLIDTGTDSQ